MLAAAPSNGRRTDIQWVMLGRVCGLYGVLGSLKVFSYTERRDGILDYHPLYFRVQGRWQAIPMEAGRLQGKSIVVKLAGYDDRDTAAKLLGADIAVRREQLPRLKPDEYYWSDLEGLRVITTDNIELGHVERLLETGANDVLVIAGERERLLPFLPEQVIVEIDLEGGLMRVDWDPEL